MSKRRVFTLAVDDADRLKATIFKRQAAPHKNAAWRSLIVATGCWASVSRIALLMFPRHFAKLLAPIQPVAGPAHKRESARIPLPYCGTTERIPVLIRERARPLR